LDNNEHDSEQNSEQGNENNEFDEFNADNADNADNAEHSDTPTLRGYRVVCAKLGLSMCVYFIFRLFAGWVSLQLGGIKPNFGETAYSLIQTAVIIVLVYCVPLLFTAFIFNSFVNYKGKYRELYKKPRRLARALGTFPATFGFGHGIALFTLLISYLITRYLGGHTYIEDLLRPTVLEPSTDIVSALTMVFLLVVIAPVFEEFWTRGIMFDALKPYGAGMAIIISSLLFGLMHGSLYMLFYTTAYGFALGYIRYATGSLFTVTILHAIVNSIGAGALLLTTLSEITNEEHKLVNTLYLTFLTFVFVMIIVGIFVFLSKIPAIRKYKIENAWTEIGAFKKTAWFLVSIPVIIMILLAFNEITGLWLFSLLW
jgi:membrane protease YdiL (CAAX protease family)